MDIANIQHLKLFIIGRKFTGADDNPRIQKLRRARLICWHLDFIQR